MSGLLYYMLQFSKIFGREHKSQSVAHMLKQELGNSSGLKIQAESLEYLSLGHRPRN